MEPAGVFTVSSATEPTTRMVFTRGESPGRDGAEGAAALLEQVLDLDLRLHLLEQMIEEAQSALLAHLAQHRVLVLVEILHRALVRARVGGGELRGGNL